MKIKIKDGSVLPPAPGGIISGPVRIKGVNHVVMAPKFVKCNVTLSADSKTITVITQETFCSIKKMTHTILNKGKLKDYFAELVEAFSLKPLDTTSVTFYLDGYYRGTSSTDVRTIGFQATAETS